MGIPPQSVMICAYFGEGDAFAFNLLNWLFDALPTIKGATPYFGKDGNGPGAKKP